MIYVSKIENTVRIDIARLQENHKEFIRNNKSILKTHQGFKSQR